MDGPAQDEHTRHKRGGPRAFTAWTREREGVIHEIEKPAFHRASHLVGGGIVYPEVLSIIVGNNPGWVFVDSPAEPATALIWSQGIQGFYLVGNGQDASFLLELDSYIDRVISPRVRELGISWFEFSCDRESWGPGIEHIFGKRGLSRAVQYVYALRAQDYQPARRTAHEAGCDIRSLDRDLMISGLCNLEFVRSKLDRFWSTAEAFLAKGMGYAVVVERRIVSLCFSAFVADATHAIDIETEDMHRRKGYGERAARRFVEACLAEGLHPHWDCMQENIASWSLAEKLGFRRAAEYSLYAFPL